MTFGGTLTRALLAGSVAWLAFGSPGFSGDLSQQQIIEQLMPHKAAPAMSAEKPLTRSLTMAPVVDPEPASGPHQALVDELRHRGNRPLTTGEREEIAAWTSE